MKKVNYNGLWFEDSPDSVAEVMESLKINGYNIQIFSSVKLFVQNIQDSLNIDFLMIDIVASSRNYYPTEINGDGIKTGLILIDEIRQGKYGKYVKSLPILIVTANPSISKSNINTNYEPIDLIKKPCTAKEIDEKLHNIVKGSTK